MQHVEANTKTISKSAYRQTRELLNSHGLKAASISATKTYAVVRDAAGEMIATLSTRAFKNVLISINV